MLEVCLLGTGGMMPLPYRWLTSLMARYNGTSILIDCGEGTQIAMKEQGWSPKPIDIICFTHFHADHISGLGVLARKYGIPIYATKGTIDAIRNTHSLGNIDEELFHYIREDEKCTVKDMALYPIRTSHDAAEPVAYRISHDKQKIAVITDLGCYNDYTVECLRDLDVLYLEANHDIHMLQVGPYPYYLKQRILGDRGHLSNENAGRLLSRILHDELQTVLLGHLSKENNLPELAFESVRMEINMGENPYKAGDFDIRVARRSEVTPAVYVG